MCENQGSSVPGGKVTHYLQKAWSCWREGSAGISQRVRCAWQGWGPSGLQHTAPGGTAQVAN